MKWPENSVAYALEAAYSLGCIEAVSVEVSWLEPLHLCVTVRERSCGDVTCDLELPHTTIDGVDLWCEEIAWITGARDLRRWVSADRNITIGCAIYSWRWRPIYRRYGSPDFRRWLAEDESLDDDGGRSGPYPMYRPHTLLKSARAYPAAGTGREFVSVFEFAQRRRNVE